MQRQQRTIEVMVTPAAAMQALTEQYAAVRAADRRAGGGVARLGPRAPAHHTRCRLSIGERLSRRTALW